MKCKFLRVQAHVLGGTPAIFINGHEFYNSTGNPKVLSENEEPHSRQERGIKRRKSEIFYLILALTVSFINHITQATSRNIESPIFALCQGAVPQRLSRSYRTT